MGLLSDFTAYVDSLKRRGANTAREFAADPIGLLGRNVSALSESLPAAPGEPPNEMLARPGMQDWATGVAMNAPTMGLLGHTVYHGSPYKFDKFDASKIGTGEGAQAYGHGLYFADDPMVAEAYYKKFDAAVKRNPDSFATPVSGGLSKQEQSRLIAMRSWDKKRMTPAEKAQLKNLEKREASHAEASAAAVPSKASFYKADLPDEWLPKMLDWDKPLSQQPEAVRKHFEPLVAKTRKVMAKSAGPEWGEFAAPQKYDPLGAELMQLLRGGDRMDAASVLSGGTGGSMSAEHLRQAGIPGIRYLDGGSRGAGEGSYNYVVFPGMEHLLKILERE